MTDIQRPSQDVIAALSEIGVDTVTSTMEALGVRRTFIEGPVARVQGSKIVGPALTLRFVPQREDLMKGYQTPGEEAVSLSSEGEEEGEKRARETESRYSDCLQSSNYELRSHDSVDRPDRDLSRDVCGPPRVLPVDDQSTQQ